MSSADSRHAVIVGAGPAGAVLANLLATRGVRVTLLERQAEFAREFRGEALMPGGIAVLKNLGMDEVLETVPQITPQSFEFYANRKRVFRLEGELAGDTDLQPRIYSQPALLEAIVAGTRLRSDMKFERGASVKELLHGNGRVVGLRVRTSEGERQIDADLVIGCDGRSSIVRRKAPLEVKSQDLPMDVLWSKLPAPDIWQGKPSVCACIGKGHLFFAYMAYDGLMQIAWIIPKGSFGELRERGTDEWVSDMANHVPLELSDHLLKHKDRLVHPFLLSTAADCVRRWSIPGAMVIGDAAHTMSPVGGQGVNIALRDAVVAANHLVPVLQSGGSLEAIDAAALRIEEERMPEVSRIQSLQATPPKIMLRDTWWAELARQVPRLMRFAPVRALASRAAQPALFGTADVRLQV
ncbi:MAG: FAD-dependent monooxygenase [Myxococcales bacterium]|nr:monooxygenase [Myxococcales bacterium]HIK83631.1 monooxygenase [Myxococcales bacterium]